MQAEKTALVWVDVDNDFLEEGGALHGAVKAGLEQNQVKDKINLVNAAARDKGAQVIFIPIVFSDDYQEMGDDPQGILGVVKDAGALREGTWGAQVADGLEVQDEDLVLGRKSSLCAFETTNLEEELTSRGISQVAVGGLITNACVESTLRTAYDKGLSVYSLTDCSATLSPESHQASIEHSWPLFSTPVTGDEFLEKLNA